jgi:hypothetical protein
MNLSVRLNIIFTITIGFILFTKVNGQEDRGFKVFQFPKDMIPRIDGQAGKNIVILEVAGPAGSSGLSRIWDVAVR